MSDDNARMIMMQEGHLLQHAGTRGKDFATNLARCEIDGSFNALMRLAGADEAATFAFAVSDRVVGRLKTPTQWPLPKIAEALPAPVPVMTAPALPAAPSPRRYSFWTIFAIGWCVGFVSAFGFLVRVSL
jgi:hypothetical protein